MTAADSPQYLIERTYRVSYAPAAAQGSQTSSSQGPRTVRVSIGQPAATWLPSSIKRIESLTALAAGWDSYGARPVQADAAVQAVSFLLTAAFPEAPEPAIVPVADGGIQIEWHRAGLDVEIAFGDSHEGMYVEDLETGAVQELPISEALPALQRLLSRIG